MAKKFVECAGGVVVGPDGLIAVTTRKGKPGWSLPKGHVEKCDRDREDAARREIAEETGLTDLTLVGELGSFVRISSDGRETKRITLYLYSTAEREFDPVPKHRAEWRTRQSAWVLIRQARPADAEQLVSHEVAIDVLAARQIARRAPELGHRAELAV